MKVTLSLLTGAALIAALPSDAADRDAERRDVIPDTQSDLDRGERLAFPAKAGEIIGKEITNLQNEKIGKVGELAVDLPAGRVALVLVDYGSVLGVGGRSIAVPPQAFSYDPATKSLRVALDQAKLKDAPAFEMSRWNDAAPTNYVGETYRYYGYQPYVFGNNGRHTVARPDAPFTSPGGRLEKASRIVGLAVMNHEDEKCGAVDNLIVDLPAARIVHVIVSSGGFLGIGDALNAVPPSSFSYNAKRDSLVLNVSKEQLTTAPRFNSSEWPDFADPGYSGKVYQAYGAEPYFNTDADNTRRNVRDRQDHSLTPLDQGAGKADVETTRRIRQEILAREGLSLNARNIKVITVNGRVTLRGPVNNDSEKQAIADIANRIAQSSNVDNQIEVKQEPLKE